MSSAATQSSATTRWAVIVTAITFLSLLAAAGVRSTPGVLIMPLEHHFGWSRATISFTAATGIFVYGLVGPFAAALMQSLGIRRTMITGLSLMAAAAFASQWMRESWQFLVTWGFVSGIGSGAIASVLGAAVVNRWFARRQGLVMGILAASSATGALVFLPLLAWLSEGGNWRSVVLAASLACIALIPIVALFMPERPADVGTTRYGETQEAAAAPRDTKRAPSIADAISSLVEARRSRIFWLLFGSFFVCGLTTNGLVGTHLIAFCGDHGIAPVAAAGLLTTMGIFDLIGTSMSGWLTDRYDPKALLFFYYGLRGLSLLALPFISFGTLSLGAFAVFYGLDWIATVPPTVALTNRAFGEQRGPIVFGWVVVGHQLGAAVAAFGAGLVRQELGTYSPAFFAAGAFAVLAGFAVLMLPSVPRRVDAAAFEPECAAA
ncbi:MAG TPA: MFS transporter [Sphingomicrobium sp.]|nr:MFS transporter [Sphingomicrobium sp.]